MEELRKKYNSAVQALLTLEEVLQDIEKMRDKKEYKIYRDSAIQRFEYSIDTFWKFWLRHLEDQGLVYESPSPRLIFRDLLANSLIDKNEFGILDKAVKDRNLTSHTYIEQLAERIVKCIPDYYKAMRTIIERIEI